MAVVERAWFGLCTRSAPSDTSDPVLGRRDQRGDVSTDHAAVEMVRIRPPWAVWPVSAGFPAWVRARWIYCHHGPALYACSGMQLEAGGEDRVWISHFLVTY